MTRRVTGHSSSLFCTAARHRSRASEIETSGRPTSAVLTSPWETSTWTSITWPIAPSSDTVCAVAQGISRPPARGRRRQRRGRPGAPRPGRSGPRRPARRGPRSHRSASRRSRSALAAVHRLQRGAEVVAGPGLHLAHHEHRTVAQHQVDLAELAAPVAVEQDHAVRDQAAGGDGLAVPAQGPALPGRAHRNLMHRCWLRGQRPITCRPTCCGEPPASGAALGAANGSRSSAARTPSG